MPDEIAKEQSKLLPQILILALVGGGSVTGSRFLDDDQDDVARLTEQVAVAQREEPAQWAAIKGLRAELDKLKGSMLNEKDVAEDIELYWHRNIDEIEDKLETIEDHTEGKHECKSST